MKATAGRAGRGYAHHTPELRAQGRPPHTSRLTRRPSAFPTKTARTAAAGDACTFVRRGLRVLAVTLTSTLVLVSVLVLLCVAVRTSHLPSSPPPHDQSPP